AVPRALTNSTRPFVFPLIQLTKSFITVFGSSKPRASSRVNPDTARASGHQFGVTQPLPNEHSTKANHAVVPWYRAIGLHVHHTYGIAHTPKPRLKPAHAACR